MSRIVVCGGGVIGAATAMMLADDGHDVVVLEADADALPGTAAEAWEAWPRAGVAQFRQAHVLMTRARHVLDAELPGLTDRLLDAGCTWVDYLAAPPPGLDVPGDETMRLVTGRRPVMEAAIGAAALDRPRVTVRRGVRVAELLTGPEAIPGVPHVEGVRTTGGEKLAADLVVDATGRRSAGTAWLGDLGAAPETESVDRGFVYYTRYFTGPRRPARIGPSLAPVGSFSVLTLEGDNDTWSVTIYGLTSDRPLREVRHGGTFERVVRACPLQAHWLDGTPITGVLAMAGTVDRRHRFSRGGVPVVTGFAAVGDAWACTNPSAGRGLSMGLVHAQALREVVRTSLGNPALFAAAWEEATDRSAAPFFESQAVADRTRNAEMAAEIAGQAPPQLPVPGRLLSAARADADAFRAVVEVATCVSLPHEVLARPAVAAAVAAADPAPFRMPGPDRGSLVSLLAA